MDGSLGIAAPSGGALGKNTNLVSPSEARRLRYSLRAHAGRLLPGERVANCSQFPGHEFEGVSVHYNDVAGVASFGSLGVCGSVWACPVCSARINAERRADLKDAMKRARGMGMGAYLVTLTIQHQRKDKISDLIEYIKSAWRRVKSGKGWELIKGRFGIVGHVTATEITHGGCGWHPHMHALIFTDNQLSDSEIEDMKTRLTARYLGAAEKLGVYVSAIHGVDVRKGEAAAKYVTKFGLEYELTGVETKKTEHGVTPFQLLSMSREGSEHAGALFVEYARAMKGRRQLIWSRGLRDLLGMAIEKTDTETAQENDGEVLAVLTFDQWKAIKNKIECKVLEYIEFDGSTEAVKQVLSYLGAPWCAQNDEMLARYNARYELKKRLGESKMYTDGVEIEHLFRRVAGVESVRAQQWETAMRLREEKGIALSHNIV